MSKTTALFRRLRLRGKMLALILPLVLIPILLVGGGIGYISTQKAYQGITRLSKADLDHMAEFTRDLLASHYQQFQVYRQEQRRRFIKDLDTLTRTAQQLVKEQAQRVQAGKLSRQAAQKQARRELKQFTIGDSGYIYALNSKGILQVHVTRQGEDISDSQDENGRYFIRQMIRQATSGEPGHIHHLRYPWRNPALGDNEPRQKMAAFLYYPQWDWIIAAAAYVDETFADTQFEQQALADLKAKIKQKKVGETGYIYCMNRQGTFTIHPYAEGENHLHAKDASGQAFIQEMIANKEGWIRYPWQNETDAQPRMKIVRYKYFKPWDWIVAVGSYEDEFYQPAEAIKRHSTQITIAITLVAALATLLLSYWGARLLTQPISNMIAAIRRIKRGHLDERLEVKGEDELAELASTFNRMTAIIQRNQALEANLAQQGKLASIGVLASGVAHEINNPLGVILGNASYLERKLDPESQERQYIQDIRTESKRCRKIVQDLLSYARTPQPHLEATDINALLEQILDFAGNHTALRQVTIQRHFTSDLAPIAVDGDQMRQVAINLALNAGNAMTEGGTLTVTTDKEEDWLRIRFQDTGEGISQEVLEQVFEPFYTTKEKGTGLGLAITKQIIERHQGHIQIENQLGKGTCISIWLPYQQTSRYEQRAYTFTG